MTSTSFSILAFLANGHLPERGPYQNSLEKSVKWLISICKQGELGHFTHSLGHSRNLYGQGFAVLALSQVYGMIGYRKDRFLLRGDVETCLNEGIRAIEKSQGVSGGWHYQIGSSGEEGSVTVTQVMALRAARNIGLPVSKAVVDRGVEYLRSTQIQEEGTYVGGFRYGLGGSDVSTVPLAAGGTLSLMLFGHYYSKDTNAGIRYLKRHDPIALGEPEYYTFDATFYTRFYSALAYYLHDDDNFFWSHWYPELIKRFQKDQQSDGSFSHSRGTFYATSLSVLALSVPFQMLPIFQR